MSDTHKVENLISGGGEGGAGVRKIFDKKIRDPGICPR